MDKVNLSLNKKSDKIKKDINLDNDDDIELDVEYIDLDDDNKLNVDEIDLNDDADEKLRYINKDYINLDDIVINRDDKKIWNFSTDFSLNNEKEVEDFKFIELSSKDLILNKYIFDKYKIKFTKSFLNHMNMLVYDENDKCLTINKDLLLDLSDMFIFLTYKPGTLEISKFYELFLIGKMFISDKSVSSYLWNENYKLFNRVVDTYAFEWFRLYMKEFYILTGKILYNLFISKFNETNNSLSKISANLIQLTYDITKTIRKDEINEYIDIIIDDNVKNEITELIEKLIDYRDELVFIKNSMSKIYNKEYESIMNKPRYKLYMNYCIKSSLLKVPDFYDLFQGKDFTFPIADNKVIEFFKNSSLKYEVKVRERNINDYFTKTTDNIYDTSLKSEELENFLQDILVDENNNYDPELCEAIFVALGNILIGNYNNKIFIFLGSNRYTLKNIFTNAISRVIGEFNTYLDSKLIIGADKLYNGSKHNKFLKELYSKRGCFIKMPENSYILSSSMLKKLAPNSLSKRIETIIKNREIMSFENKTVSFLLAEKTPNIDYSDCKILNMMIYFNFNAKFRYEDEFITNKEDLSIEEKNKLMRENKGKYSEDIRYKKATIDYLDTVHPNFYHCLFNKMVEGALKLLNGYSFPQRFRK